jgi:hypothetical protein
MLKPSVGVARGFQMNLDQMAVFRCMEKVSIIAPPSAVGFERPEQNRIAAEENLSEILTVSLP